MTSQASRPRENGRAVPGGQFGKPSRKGVGQSIKPTVCNLLSYTIVALRNKIVRQKWGQASRAFLPGAQKARHRAWRATLRKASHHDEARELHLRGLHAPSVFHMRELVLASVTLRMRGSGQRQAPEKTYPKIRTKFQANGPSRFPARQLRTFCSRPAATSRAAKLVPASRVSMPGGRQSPGIKGSNADACLARARQ